MHRHEVVTATPCAVVETVYVKSVLLVLVLNIMQRFTAVRPRHVHGAASTFQRPPGRATNPPGYVRVHTVKCSVACFLFYSYRGFPADTH